MMFDPAEIGNGLPEAVSIAKVDAAIPFTSHRKTNARPRRR